jgi:hypothetical protein
MIARREAERKAQEKVNMKVVVLHTGIVTGIFARDLFYMAF